MTLAPPGGTVTRAAPAKINLYLHVLGRRADGYHLLDSLVAFTALHDTLVVAPAAELALTVTGPFAAELTVRGTAPVNNGGASDNLVLRAARLLAAEGGVRPRASVHLCKRLPVAAGLGGGSADAAAALRALADLWQLAPSDDDLSRLALELGADVPVCVAGRAAFIGGVGERIDPAPALPSVGIVLANPGIPLATARVFAARRGPFSSPARFGSPPPDAAQLAEVLSGRSNDLEPPAQRLATLVTAVLGAISAAAGCLLSRMSGSGATCFGLFVDRDGAKRAAAALGQEHPDWWVTATGLIDDAPALKPLPLENDRAG